MGDFVGHVKGKVSWGVEQCLTCIKDIPLNELLEDFKDGGWTIVENKDAKWHERSINKYRNVVRLSARGVYIWAWIYSGEEVELGNVKFFGHTSTPLTRDEVMALQSRTKVGQTQERIRVFEGCGWKIVYGRQHDSEGWRLGAYDAIRLRASSPYVEGEDGKAVWAVRRHEEKNDAK